MLASIKNTQNQKKTSVQCSGISFLAKKLTTLIFGQKWQFLDHFYPLKEAKIDGQFFFCKKVKLRDHTLLKSHHTSKLDHFWARYLQKMVKNPYYVTTCNVFLTKKGPKRPKPDFSRNFHLFFSKVNPKCSLNLQN